MIVWSKKLSHATVPLTSTLTDFKSKNFFCIIRTHCLGVALLRSTDCNVNFVNGTES